MSLNIAKAQLRADIDKIRKERETKGRDTEGHHVAFDRALLNFVYRVAPDVGKEIRDLPDEWDFWYS